MAAARLLALAAAAVASARAQPTPATTTAVTVDWGTTLRALRTTPAFQTVVNPVTTRQSPIHDAVYASIDALGAQYQRYVPWLPYPKLGVAAMEPPSTDALCGFVNSGGAPQFAFSTTLDCGGRGYGTIASVQFASYGRPTGWCGSLQADATCHRDVTAIVAAACVGKANCTLTSDDATFGAAPCGAQARLAVQVTCSAAPPGAVYTYWDFAPLDAGMLDFLSAAASGERIAIPNFSTIPAWLFNSSSRVLYPDDVLGETWDYESQGGAAGNVFRDPSLKELGDYYGRLYAHYIEGGFTDEAGAWVPGYKFPVAVIEILNEPEGEHFGPGGGVALYTKAYDAIVAGIKRWAPNGSKGVKFMGLALEGSGNIDWVTYFLNATNHAPGAQWDAISFHHYAIGTIRNGSDAAGSGYEEFFPSGDQWLTDVQAIMAARDALSPGTMLDADEVGVILPDDNDAIYTSAEPGFPLIYWNAAAASYAYLYGQTSALGLDILGESQLVGYPSFNFTRTDAPYDGALWAAPPQYPSVALLNWTDGAPTARYWALKLLVEEMRPGAPSGALPPAQADVLVNTTTAADGPALPGGAFCGRVVNLQNLTLACDQPGAVISAIQFADYGTPGGSCGAFTHSACTEANASAVVASYCVGKPACTVPAGPPAWGDPCYLTVKYLAVQATCSAGSGRQVGASAPVYAQAYREAGGAGARKVLLVNKSASPQNVTLPGAGAAGAIWRFVDASTAFGPPAMTTLAADTWTLAPYALGVLRM